MYVKKIKKYMQKYKDEYSKQYSCIVKSSKSDEHAFSQTKCMGLFTNLLAFFSLL